MLLSQVEADFLMIHRHPEAPIAARELISFPPERVAYVIFIQIPKEIRSGFPSKVKTTRDAIEALLDQGLECLVCQHASERGIGMEMHLEDLGDDILSIERQEIREIREHRFPPGVIEASDLFGVSLACQELFRKYVGIQKTIGGFIGCPGNQSFLEK